MKVTLVVAAFVGLIGRCSDFPLDPHDWPGHVPPPAADDDDAGVANTSCLKLGLYVDPYCKHLARGVVAYTPSYELWSDGADKQRYIYLPEGTQIDTSNPDRWNFPVHTRLYKTFSQDGLRLETRVFEKTAETRGIDSWSLKAFAWQEDQRTVVEVPEGMSNVLGTEHDIPKHDECVRCHTRAGEDIVNGFEAVQLNHAGRGWTLERLIEQGRLVNGASGAEANVTLDNARVPGEPVEQAALGYLHANCGNCHVGPTAPPKAQPLDLSVPVGTAAASDAPAYKAACSDLKRWTGHGSFVRVIDPGSAATSGMIGRMGSRPFNAMPNDQMPPLGTEMIDEVGIKRVSAWIDQLDVQCETGAEAP